MMNNKGQLTAGLILAIALGALILIVGTVLGFKVIFTNGFIFYLLGGGLLVLTFIYGVAPSLQGNFTREKRNFVLILFILGILLIAVPLTGILQGTSVTGSAYFEAPYFGTVKCAPAIGGSLTSGSITIPADGKVLQCPTNTKNCDVLISVKDEGFIAPPRKLEWYVCDPGFLNCESKNYVSEISGSGFKDKLIRANIPKDKMIYVQLQASTFPFAPYKGYEGASAKLVYVPYILWKKDSLRGGENPIEGSTDCKMPTSSSYWLDRIVASTIKDKDGQQATIRASNNQLEPDQTYNYVSGTVTRASFGNAVTYNGNKGYCADNIQGIGKAIIYGFGTLKTASTTYTIVDLSKELGRVDCCQENQIIGSTICKNFKLQPLEVDDETGETNAECSLVNPCNPGKFTYSDNDRTSFQYKCVSGKCVVSDIQQEECTKTSQCPSDRVCVNFKCMLASTIPDAEPATTAQTIKEACDAKAAAHPLLGYTIIERTEQPSFGDKLKYYVTFGLAGTNKPITTESCEPKNVPYIIMGVVVVVLGALVLLLLKTPAKKGRRTRR